MEARGTIQKYEDSLLKTNIIRTLESRRNKLLKCYELWQNSCIDYACKFAASVSTADKAEDVATNIKPVRSEYRECMDKRNDLLLN